MAAEDDEYERAMKWLDGLDPDVVEARDAGPFRRIIAARRGLETAERELRAAVDAARAAGDSWTLDVSREAARKRFGRPADDVEEADLKAAFERGADWTLRHDAEEIRRLGDA